MADEHRIAQAQLAPDFDDIVGIAVERRLFSRIVSREVGSPGADMVEQNDSEVGLEGSGDFGPHSLIAPEAVREHHRARSAARDAYIVAGKLHALDASTGQVGTPSAVTRLWNGWTYG